MNSWKKASQFCVFVLILIAALVAGMLIAGISAWTAIICYWVVLTVKNLCDAFDMMSK